jgi:hypothetical protein
MFEQRECPATEPIAGQLIMSWLPGLAPRMRHFSNSCGFRGRVARLLIPISGENEIRIPGWKKFACFVEMKKCIFPTKAGPS